MGWMEVGFFDGALRWFLWKLRCLLGSGLSGCRPSVCDVVNLGGLVGLGALRISADVAGPRAVESPGGWTISCDEGG